MALFESYERRIDQINAVLNSYGIASLEEAEKITKDAGLDVYAEEPSKNHALYSHPRVSCTPHIGAATCEAQKRIGAEIVSIIESF